MIDTPETIAPEAAFARDRVSSAERIDHHRRRKGVAQKATWGPARWQDDSLVVDLAISGDENYRVRVADRVYAGARVRNGLAFTIVAVTGRVAETLPVILSVAILNESDALVDELIARVRTGEQPGVLSPKEYRELLTDRAIEGLPHREMEAQRARFEAHAGVRPIISAVDMASSGSNVGTEAQ